MFTIEQQAILDKGARLSIATVYSIYGTYSTAFANLGIYSTTHMGLLDDHHHHMWLGWVLVADRPPGRVGGSGWSVAAASRAASRAAEPISD
jgi:hypothetical protein